MTVKTRLTEHKRRSSVNSEVTHPSTSKRPVALGLKIVPVDHRRLKGGVKETIYIRAYKSSLNADGGRCNLPPVWNNLLESRVLREMGPIIIKSCICCGYVNKSTEANESCKF